MHKHYSDGSVFGLSSVTTCDYMIKYSEYIPKLVLLYYGVYARALFSSQKILQNFSDFRLLESDRSMYSSILDFGF
jgi:hypothetical protein